MTLWYNQTKNQLIKDNRAHENKEAVHPDIPGVSSFYFADWR